MFDDKVTLEIPGHALMRCGFFFKLFRIAKCFAIVFRFETFETVSQWQKHSIEIEHTDHLHRQNKKKDYKRITQTTLHGTIISKLYINCCGWEWEVFCYQNKLPN